MNTHTDTTYTEIKTDSTGQVIDSRVTTEDGRIVKDWDSAYIRQTAHFDDQPTRFVVLTRKTDGATFVTDETYFGLADEFENLPTLTIDPETGLRVMDWEVNFDDEAK